MKSYLWSLLFLFVLVLLTSPSTATVEVDLVGTWVGPASLEGQPDNELTVVIEKKDGVLSGKMTGQYDTLVDAPLDKIKVEEGVFSFEVTASTDGGDFLIVFKMNVDGDNMTGEFDAPDLGMGGTWEAERQK